MRLANEVLRDHPVVWMECVHRQQRRRPRAAKQPLSDTGTVVWVDERERGVTLHLHPEQRGGIEAADDAIRVQTCAADEFRDRVGGPVAPQSVLFDLNIEADPSPEGVHDLFQQGDSLVGEFVAEVGPDVDFLEAAPGLARDVIALPGESLERAVVMNDELPRAAAADVELEPWSPELRSVTKGGHGVLGPESRSTPVGLYLHIRSALRRFFMGLAARAPRGARNLCGGIGHRSHRTGLWLGLVSCVFCFVVSPPALAGEPPDWGVHLEAEVDPSKGTIAGRAEITLRNPTARPLSAVRVYLYPEHYSDKPVLDDILWERVYPGRWEPGSMSLGPVRQRGVEGEWVSLSWSRLDGEVPIAEIALATPLLPGEHQTISLSFMSQVPHKYGTYGRSRGILTASGGWYPMPVRLTPEGRWLDQATPAEADYSVHLTSPTDHSLVLGDLTVPPPSMSSDPAAFVPSARPLQGTGSVEDVGEARTSTWKGQARWVGMSLHRRGEQRNIPMRDGTTVTWVGRRLTRGQVRWLHRAVDAARDTVKELALDVPPRDLLVVEARMRRRLVEIGEGVIYVSDRYLEADRLFWRYHDVHFARAVLATDMEPSVLIKESAQVADFVLDALSWEFVGDYLEARWRNHVGLRGLLQRFAFFPQVESLLETPAFPFADQIFDNPWIVDPLGSDLRRFNRPLRSGRTLSLRLDDRVGSATKRQTMLRSLRGGSDSPLLSAMAADSGVDVSDLVKSWSGEVPRVDFRIASVKRSRTPEGLHRTSVTVRRDELEGSPPEELVEIRLSRGLMRKKGQITLRWQGREESASWDVLSAKRMAVVEIDPQARLTELDENGLNLRQDNRRPQALRVSGFGYAGLSITGQGFDAYGLLNFRPKHNTRHQVNLRASTNEQSIGGGGLTYAHYFGPPRWGLSLKHRVVFTADFVWLNQNFRPTDAPLLAELSAGYVYETRSNSFMPTRGGRFAATIFAGKDFSLKSDGLRTIQESGFVGADVQVIRLLKLHPFHVLALRGKAGFVLGNVKHSQFTVGGNSDLRGTPERFEVTPARALGVVEWRHLFFKDADLPLPFQRVRGLQGSLFLEGSIAAKSLTELPSVRDLHFSVGYGFRWFVDWLGVLPGAWGMDFAWSPGVPPGLLPVAFSPDEWPEVPFQVYFVGSQSF